MEGSKKSNLQNTRKNLTVIADGNAPNLRLRGIQKIGNGNATETGKRNVKNDGRRKRKINAKSMCVSGIEIKCDNVQGHPDKHQRNVKGEERKEKKEGKVCSFMNKFSLYVLVNHFVLNTKYRN